MSTYLLDTNACVVWMRGKDQRLVSMANSKPGDLLICSVVVGELLFGALHSGDVPKHLKLVSTLLQIVPSLPYDDEDANIYANVRHALASKGMLIGPHDLQIASIALRHQLIVVTHNTSEFSRVPGLVVEDWQS